MKVIKSFSIEEILKLIFTIMFVFALCLAIISGCGGGGSDDDDSGGTESTGTTDGGTTSDPTTTGGTTGDDSSSEETGSISGIITSAEGIPLDSIHVRAVKISDPGIQIGTFSGLGSDLTFSRSSADSKLILDDIGVYRIDHLPQGSYKVLIEKMDDRSGAFDPDRYSDFVDNENPPIAFPDEYYNGENESGTDNPMEFTSVFVFSGQLTSNIDIITNN